MLRVASRCLAVSFFARALAFQVPLGSSHRWQVENTEWDLSNRPNPNATDHLVFETVHSLLQLWPNTRMRNGHTIVPGVIPKGTLLYHGRADNKIPAGPEWTALDPEHSYVFCRDIFDGSQVGGWFLTLMTTRPLKVVHFDGSSAVKIPFGSMDTQDLLTWGEPSDCINVIEDEEKRVQYLCEWGKRFGVDGIVRMQPAFELVLCDFSAGVRVISFENLASKWFGPFPLSSYELFSMAEVGSWHSRFPGETRVQLDLTGLVSFYDTLLAPSLVPIRAGQERWDHRAINISSEELSAVRTRLEENLMKPDGVSSGIDWKTLLQVIVDRYADRLELVRYLLHSPATSPDDILDLAKKAQTQLRIMLTPYILLSATPTGQSGQIELDWTIPIFKLCSTTHTHSVESQLDSMTDSEKLVLQSIRGTSREICRVVTKMWAAGVYAGIDPLLNTNASPDVTEIALIRNAWAEELDALMKWLDWSVWVKCNGGCDSEEMCYLPTWPIGFPWFAKIPPRLPLPIDDFTPQDGKSTLALQIMAMRNLANDVHDTVKPGPDEWIRPQPKCIRRIYPYRF